MVLVVKNLSDNAGHVRDEDLIPELENPLEEEMHPTPIFLPGKSHGERNVAGYSTCGHKEWDMTKHLST